MNLCHLQNNAEIDSFLESRDATRWAFMTAVDPMRKPLPAEENSARLADMVEHAKGLGCVAFVAGEDGSPQWLPNNGVLILNILDEDAWMLGRAFGQSAILVGEKGRSWYLRY